MKYFIRHYKPYFGDTFYLLNIPDVSEKGFYRQTTSIESFRQREIKRRFPFDDNGKPLYQSINGNNIEYCEVKPFDEFLHTFKTMNEILKKCKEKEKPFPLYTEYHSVWDFYHAIYYDYKKQQYDPCLTKNKQTLKF